jgi:hypothetical protein
VGSVADLFRYFTDSASLLLASTLHGLLLVLADFPLCARRDAITGNLAARRRGPRRSSDDERVHLQKRRGARESRTSDQSRR